MTPGEEDEFYRGFRQDCLETGDFDGDPRALRISPSTFARWAIGAVRGDSYVEAEPIPDASSCHDGRGSVMIKGFD
jgi:hypothetical protein